MKQFFIALGSFLVLMTAQAADQCEEGRYGEWKLLQHAVQVWECDIESEVGGITLGFGPSYQVMAGEADYTCRGYDAYGDTEVIGCYRERVAMAMVGKGVGIGLSVVNSMKTRAVGIRLLDLEPENFIGFLRAGIGANAGIQLGDISGHAGADMSFSLANGIDFSMKLYEMDGLINAHAGAHLTGFAMHELDYDSDTSIIVDSVSYFSGILGKIFDKLKAEGSQVDKEVFSVDHIVADAPEATKRAKKATAELEEATGDEYRHIGIRVFDHDEELEGQTMNDYIERGLEKAENACNKKLAKAFAAFDCKNTEAGESCRRAYFRAVCEN